MAKLTVRIKEVNSKNWAVVEQNEVNEEYVPLWNAVLVVGGAIETLSRLREGTFVIKVIKKEDEKRVRTFQIAETLSLPEKRDLFARILESFDYNAELIKDEMVSNFYDSKLFQDLEWDKKGEPVGIFRKDVQSKLCLTDD